ncbi:alpha/beta fold hydrolase [Sphingomonas sp. MAH-20]|uniref:Alpha/beta fold hydrolase n=1 Tax=Sphingomonas horti TaxID=2682842 RepID=A0A6I4IXY4_9SPHN|nr:MULTISPECIES: alpha/beta hydrolase [Sphingomonas]MBA2920842.1 alpha/beta hydrolase [Sphingomonas sp. CGMCC 1.13658]MVO76828.1 alpha/beta fold hydrolase [Sphingomonas horti]
MSTLLPETLTDRRGFVQGAAAIATALAEGGAPALAAAPRVPFPLGPVRQVETGVLSIGYVETGPASGPAVLLFHGWPYAIDAFAEVAPLLAARGYRVIVPHLRGHGSTVFRSAETPRNAQQAALAADGIALMDALKIDRAIVAGFDWGARTADIMAVLWPERCKALVSVSGYLIGSQAGNAKPLPPQAELQWWYQFYFATERGKAGYAANTKAFNQLIWQLASPKWKFDAATFDRSAAVFTNPDHVAIVIHNYRWRLGLAEGEAQYDAVEARLAAMPPVTIPSITMEGDANGAPHPDPVQYRAKFTGPYEHRLITGGIGHNLPQEAPAAFAKAVLDVARLAG